MLPYLGRLIQKHPWFVILFIVMITIGFSSFIPRLQFKTDFEEFTPDDELVQASKRIEEYFGANQQIIFLRIQKQNSGNILTPQIFREIYTLQKELETLSEVQGSFSIVTFLDVICQIEFGKPLESCTDEEIDTALHDLLYIPNDDIVQLFPTSDPNEDIDYQRFPRFSRGVSVDSADIKNCFLSKTNTTITFTINVYDLSDVTEPLKPVFPKVNVMEWYIDFNNLILPFEELEINYRIAAHIEPQYPIWEFGRGFLSNLKELIQHIKNHDLLNTYKKEVYLWIKSPDQPMYIPINLTTGNVTFDIPHNNIHITVSLEELGMYGIAPQFGSFSLPAKLSTFSAGVRYYQTPYLRLPGGRFTVNTSYFFSKLLSLQSKPLIGSVASRILQQFGNISWENLDELYEMMEQTNMLPSTLALQDLESSWMQADTVQTENPSETQFYIVPNFYDDLRITALSFLSKDYEKTKKPEATLVFLQLQPTKDYDEIIAMTTNVVDRLTMVNQETPHLRIEATGNGIMFTQINEITSEANKIIAPAIFIIIMGILFINFRRVSYVVLPMLTLVVSTIWLFGCMALLGISFNVIAVALVPLVLGLGVDYAVHLFHNYRVELDDGKTPAEAIKNSVSEIGTAMFLAMLTTVIAFLSFLTATVPPIRDFGILLALGVAFTFLTSITLLASLRYLLDKRKIAQVKQRSQGLAVRRIMGVLSKKVIGHQKKILLFMILLSLVFVSGATQIKTGYDMKQFAPNNTPAYELFDEIAEDFPFSSQNQEYILIEGDVATVEALQGIALTHENIKDDSFVAKNKDGTIKTVSVYTIIQQAIENNESLIKKFNIDGEWRIPRTDSDVKALYDYLYNGVNLSRNLNPSEGVFSKDGGINVSMISNFSIEVFGSDIKNVLFKENGRYQAALIRVYVEPGFIAKDKDMYDQRQLLKNEINDDISAYGVATGVATGENIISLTITNSLTESQITSTAISILLAALVLILVYRNLTLGLIALIPVGISIIWILGTMYFIGYTLNALTITVTSITIGIGIDYAIHATERFRFIADKTGDVLKSVSETISHTGGALLIAALTTALGFIILLLAPIPSQQQFGFILAVTITYSFLTSIFILPLVLYRWASWRKKRKGYIISTKGMVLVDGKWVKKGDE